MRRVLRSMESRIIGSRINNAIDVIVSTSAAMTIAGRFDASPNTAIINATARAVMIQPAQNVNEKPDNFIQCQLNMALA